MRAAKLSATFVATLFAAVGGGWLWLVRDLDPASEWPGVDESVIGQIVRGAGGEHARPLLAWVQGDLLLFMFLCAGLLAGFVLGYCARVAFVEQREAPRPPASDPLGERTR